MAAHRKAAGRLHNSANHAVLGKLAWVEEGVAVVGEEGHGVAVTSAWSE